MSFFFDWLNNDLLGPIPMLVWVAGVAAIALVAGTIGVIQKPIRQVGFILLAAAAAFGGIVAAILMTAVDGRDLGIGRTVLFLNNAVIYIFGTALAAATALAIGYGLLRNSPRWVVGALVASLVGVALLFARQSVLEDDLFKYILAEPADAQFAHGPGYETEPEISIENGMAFVPAGPFLMGSLSSYQTQPIVLSPYGDERPMRAHYLDAYHIDVYEVTNSEFSEFVSETDYLTDAEVLDRGRRWAADGWHDGEGLVWFQPRYQGDSIEARDDHPVVQVSWNDATAYCKWAGKRLPTEAEWEKAARGPFGQEYPWGEGFDPTKLNYCDKNCEDLPQFKDDGGDDGYRWTAPVGSYPEGRSYYGAYDMAGNVWEWVADAYGPYYYYYSPYSNPSGPKVKGFERRVVRGGSFTSERGYSRATSRSYDPPYISFFGVGFRCAKDAKPAGQ